MKRVKFFQKTNRPDELTDMVNQWLDENYDARNIKINHRVTGRMDTTTVVMIEYEIIEY